MVELKIYMRGFSEDVDSHEPLLWMANEAPRLVCQYVREQRVKEDHLDKLLVRMKY